MDQKMDQKIIKVKELGKIIVKIDTFLLFCKFILNIKFKSVQISLCSA